MKFIVDTSYRTVAALRIFIPLSVLPLLAFGLLGCSKIRPTVSFSSSGESLSMAEMAAGYTNFQKMTASEVYVNPKLALSCVGASKQQVDEARVRFGPHAHAAIHIYMNKLAADAFGKDTVAYPIGAVIVKQKLFLGYRNQDGQFVTDPNAGVGGMVKRSPGYDPDHGDWEYFYFENTAKIENGRIATCVQCHASAKSHDYVFGTWKEPTGYPIE